MTGGHVYLLPLCETAALHLRLELVTTAGTLTPFLNSLVAQWTRVTQEQPEL